MTRPPFVLLIFDGWGIAPSNRGNAIRLAQTPVFDRLIAMYPTMVAQSAGEAVGLPWGEMGNSEVGHLNIGAGKILYQDLPRITKSITDGSFYENAAFKAAIEHVRKHSSALHLMGMVSSGGVHSFHEHLNGLIDLCARERISNTFIHAFLDGRDVPYNSGKNFIVKLQKTLEKAGTGTIATLSGRFWAMDRDRHWDRIQKAYDAIVKGVSEHKSTDVITAVDDSYKAGVYDEEFVPTVITHSDGTPVATVHENDAVIFFNFRNDRARQLTHAFVDDTFTGFARDKVQNLFFVTMTEYEDGLPVTVAFPKEHIDMPIARVISDAGLRQLHIAETEKYAHVTFFFNGGREEAFPGEERVLIPSPSVPSYAQKPEMSARAITDRVVEELGKGNYDFYVINFANADMVGHTGAMPSIIKAIEMLDSCLGQIVDATLAAGGTMLITADHGNAEESMNLQTGVINKEHSTNPVPVIVVGRQWEGRSMIGGRDIASIPAVGFLADVAPTILALMGLPKPVSMTGRSLLQIS